MFKPGDLVFARVEGWCPWPGRIMCKVTRNRYKVFFYGSYQESLVKIGSMWSWEGGIPYSDLPVGNPEFNQAVDEMLENPDIFVVDYNDRCDHKCITCDQRRNVNLGELNQPLDENIEADLNNERILSNVRPVKRKKKNTEKRKPRKMMNVISSTTKRRKNRMINQLYFLPPSGLREKPINELKRMLKELNCPICEKVHRSPIGLEIHMKEFHSDFLAQEIKAREVATRKRTKTKKPVQVDEVLVSDSSLVDIDELLHSYSEESCSDDVDDLLQSSGDELCQVNMERRNDNVRFDSVGGGHDGILMSKSSQDEIVIVNIKKKLNETSGANVGPLSDLNASSDSDTEIIDLVDGYADFSEKRIQTFKKLKMVAEVYLQKLSVDDPLEFVADVSIDKNEQQSSPGSNKESIDIIDLDGSESDCC